ncbi:MULTISPECIES: beta-propeller fold lactonase family protein [Anaeromyxobacter]|uniref:hypothetical protein n=1 Tax=Anaeromyxobacter TaxID=161492 RepID=UPI001F573F4D|nr:MULTISPECIES: hypothetical protein [unclassified Anaeromyxobacter]
MRTRTVLQAVVLASVLLACAARPRVAAREPLSGEGDLFVYVQPFSPEAEKLAVTVRSVAVVTQQGESVALELVRPVLSGRDARHQRLFAHGRLAPGQYAGLLVDVSDASLRSDGGMSNLLVPQAPTRIDARFDVRSGGARVLLLYLKPAEAIERNYGFTPAFAVATPEIPVTTLAGASASTALNDVFVLDKKARQVVAAVPTGREPRGIALDERQRRAYVALAGDDEVAVVDLVSAETLSRVRLSAGDRPGQVALAQNGQVLIVLNEGSYTVSFVDTVSWTELGRTVVGPEPEWLVLDPSGRRAYVLSRRTNTITVVDTVARTTLTTVPTEPEPLRATLNSAGNRLYVTNASSPYVSVLSVPDLATSDRIFAGLGAGAILVDRRTDLLYVAMRGEPRIQVFDPFSLLPVDTLELPGAASWMVIDDVENTLFLLMPESRAIAVLDLASRSLLSVIDVGDDPYGLAIAGARGR